MMEGMKQTGIRWIGEIPSDWNTKRIKYMATLKGRIGWQGLTSEEYQDEGAYLITGVDFLDGGINWEQCEHVPMKRWEEAKDIQIQNGDLLITKDGTVGKVAIVSDMPGATSLNSGVLRIMTLDGYSRRFLYWVLQSEVFWNWFNFRNAGNSTITHLYQGDFDEFVYAFPDFEEQEMIANVLESECTKLDEIITMVQQQIDVLQKYKRSFVTEAVTKGIDCEDMRDSGIWIGQIPVNWTISKIKYLVNPDQTYPIGDGDHGMIKADDYLSEGIPYIRVLNLTWGNGLSMDDVVYIDEAMNAKIKNSELHPKDILIAKTGATIGKTGIVPESIPRSNTTSHVGKITLPETHCPEYFFHQMNSDVIQLQISDLSAMQSTRPELGIEGLKNLMVVVPPLATQEKIAHYLDEHCKIIDDVIKSKQAQLDTIRSHKSSLIFEYVTGKKRVKEVV